MTARNVTVMESGQGPYGQSVRAGDHVFSADEPHALGGMDTGPDPFELVMAGLGACTAMTIRMYANRKGIKLERVTVRIRHTPRAERGDGAKDQFERLIQLEGSLTSDERARLLKIADRCPVSQILQRSAEITSLLVPPVEQ